MGIIKRFYFFAFILFLFVGCAALKKRTDEPEMMQNIPVTLPESSDFVKGDWPAYQWWEMFDDDQLSEIMEEAIENNPSLKAAVFRMRSAQAEARKVRSALMPSLNAQAEDDYLHLSKDSLDRYPPSTIPAVVNQINLALNFEYEIDLFGKNRDKYRAALGKAKAQSAEMSQSLLMITTLLAETYFNYQAQLAQLQINRDLTLARKVYAELTSKRVEYGLDNQVALDQAEALLLSAEEIVVNLEKEKELSESQLKILMGLGPDDPRIFREPSANFDEPFPIPENIPVDLLARRPDLMAQIWRVEASAHLIGAAKAAFFPNINLAAFVGLESLTWSKLFTIDSFAAALSPAINLPIFTGGKLTAQLDEARADFDTAVYDYNHLLLQATKEVSDQLKIMQAVNRQGSLQTDLLTKVIDVSDLTFARFKNGLDNYLLVLGSQIDVMNEGLKEISIQNDRHLAVLNLIKSLGGGYYEPIQH
jgi:NodT family efflux transporter outer membrane factor (OMF) lipoprotein